jgi:MFS family permease
MKKGFKKVIASFFVQRMNSQVRELYSSDLILNFAVSTVNIFEPVFLFLVFFSDLGLAGALTRVLFFYLIVYVVYFFTIPLGAKFARRFGYEASMATASIFTISFYLTLFGIGSYPNLFWVAPIFYVISKFLYWPAYHSDFARFSSDGHQGRQVSNLRVLRSIVWIVGPLLGGVLLKFFGFGSLFVVASVVILLSNVPTLITKEKFTPNTFSYFGAYKRLFAKKNRTKLLAHWGYGDELIVMVIWPIFIYVIIGDFLKLGALMSISVALTSIVSLYIGRLTDRRGGKNILRYGSIIQFFGWLFRILTRGILGIFLADAYSRIAKQAIDIPFISETYEVAQDTSVMKRIVFFEMALIVGKVLAILGCLLLLQIFTPGWNAVFVLAGVMTLFYSLL